MATKQEMIDYVLDNFDFERVHKAMVALDWTWAFSNGVPEIRELRVEARRLLNDVVYGKYPCIGSGGFLATYDKTDNFLTLQFIVTDFSCDNELKSY